MFTDSEPLEVLLRSYIDPVDSPTELGTFIRLISQAGSRVVVSRVRKRITKQYFRHGDFHVALADFRRMNPEHSRQVKLCGSLREETMRFGMLYELQLSLLKTDISRGVAAEA